MMKTTTLAMAITAAITAVFCAAPLVAQNVQDDNSGLYELIDLSDGYFSIRENVVMIEGESEIKACHFGLSAEFFAAYGAQHAEVIELTQPNVVCVPLEAMSVVTTNSSINNSRALYDFIDTSESYVQVKQSIVMIEGEDGIEFCYFDLKDEYFAAVGAGDEAAMAMNQPTVTCAPFSDVSK